MFHRVAEAASTGDDSDLILLGNAARRLLEGFVSFRSPSGGDFQGKIERAAHQADVPAELTQRIVRFVHGTSHRDEPNPSVMFQAANIPNELGQVLRFIRSCDADHFKGMCQAVDVDIRSLLRAWDRQLHQESSADNRSQNTETPDMLPLHE